MSETPSRQGAMDRARAYVDDGTFEEELTRRVAIPTETRQ